MRETRRISDAQEYMERMILWLQQHGFSGMMSNEEYEHNILLWADEFEIPFSQYDIDALHRYIYSDGAYEDQFVHLMSNRLYEALDAHGCLLLNGWPDPETFVTDEQLAQGLDGDGDVVDKINAIGLPNPISVVQLEELLEELDE